MRAREQSSITGYKRFFLINLSHESLVNYYKSNYQLMQNHKYSLTELELMIPWEREIYVTMLIEELKEQKEEMQRQQMQRG
jgi:hypothetical protein